MQGPPRLLFLLDSVGRGLLQTCCLCVGTYPASFTKHSMTGAISLPYLFTRSHNISRGIPTRINYDLGLLPQILDGIQWCFAAAISFLKETFQQNPLRCQRSFQTFYSAFYQPPLENQKDNKISTYNSLKSDVKLLVLSTSFRAVTIDSIHKSIEAFSLGTEERKDIECLSADERVLIMRVDSPLPLLPC
ncbi:uncharacterized protein TNCV_3433921 [Trichonephila clavipes]|nr:uncharacterized protein TNCV_3433921 [Trichonephila clavipes]